MDGDVGLDGFQVLSNEVSDRSGFLLGLWCGAPIDLLTWVVGVRKSCRRHGWDHSLLPISADPHFSCYGSTRSFRHLSLP